MIRRFGGIPEDPKLLVRDDVAAGVRLQPVGSAEVVGMAVGDDDRVHPLQGNPRLVQTLLDHGVTGLLRKTRIHQGDAPFVLEDVHIDVTKTRNGDGQLGPKHAGGDFQDLVTRRQLFLLGGTRGRIGHDSRVLPGRNVHQSEVDDSRTVNMPREFRPGRGWVRRTWVAQPPGARTRCRGRSEVR